MHHRWTGSRNWNGSGSGGVKFGEDGETAGSKGCARYMEGRRINIMDDIGEVG